ncbi:MAG: hypothetical protein ACI8WY_004079, partial [Planctomycetota bacterium]
REGEPRAGPHEPYGHALWPGRPADAWDGSGLDGKTEDRRQKTEDTNDEPQHSPIRASHRQNTLSSRIASNETAPSWNQPPCHF